MGPVSTWMGDCKVVTVFVVHPARSQWIHGQMCQTVVCRLGPTECRLRYCTLSFSPFFFLSLQNASVITQGPWVTATIGPVSVSVNQMWRATIVMPVCQIPGTMRVVKAVCPVTVTQLGAWALAVTWSVTFT